MSLPVRNSTPLRYPGGKQKLTPFVREIIYSNGLEGGDYVEPYAGGAGVAMDLLVGGDVGRVHLNDSSVHVHAFWRSVLDHADALCARISAARLDIDEWLSMREIVRNPDQHGLLDVGFATFYLNRTNRSGVLTGGVIGGLQQAGKWKMNARFPKDELIRRIQVISGFGEAVVLTRMDAEDYIINCVPGLPERTLVYCDPPYFEKASRLYVNHYQPDDHRRLADVIKSMRCATWMVSYDGVPQILDCYAGCRKFIYQLQYSALKAYKGSEVFFFSDRIVVPRTSVLPHVSKGLREYTNDLHRMTA